MIILDPLMHWTDSCTWAKNGQAWAKIGFFQDFIDSFSVIVMLLLHLMGAGSNVVHKLRRKLDHLLFNIISSQNWPLSSSFHLGDSNFCNLYEYNWFVKNLSCGYLKFAPFADNRYTQQHARSFSSFSLPLFKSHHKKPAYCFPGSLVSSCLTGFCNIHTSQQLSTAPLEHNNVGSMASTEVTGVPKSKKKKLKGKRAVVRWLKFFRWKKKKEYERMTLEEKVLYKLKKARKKEERLVEALNKIEPKDSLITTHDPEVLTPEEHFYLLKLGKKCKNYVPVGRRGIFQGVILNMHLHWKKHQTLKVVVKTFTQEEVREIATELARLSGGIVLDIDEDNTIIMYRGKNYSQPPTEIMSPKVTLTRKKALDKSKYRDALHAVRRFIPKLEQDLEDLHEGMKQNQN
ncbi:hypothetical protein HPP92_026207 [Vanilla planifolia]|uniref:CRM domain-containing protein n=1 Tax=Vanilla planifolia TaxID=51239 RepID=A0A835RAS4_VANPL|nr:hypothetical protein HPP92_026207 [Vanilla planifolia]KAG0488795.1 hypothetical protein HPP92_007606 [Vanilla planifolia]